MRGRRRRSGANSSPKSAIGCPFGLHGEERNLRIDGAGGFNQVGVQVAGVHADFIGPFAEGVSQEERIGLHLPAAIEHLRRIAADAPANLGGRVAVRFGDAGGDLLGQEFLVRFVGFALKDASDSRGGVRVGRGNKDSLGWNAGLFLSEPFRQIGDFARHHAAIADGERDGRRAVIENQTAGVQAIVHLGRLPISHAAVDGNREFQWRDVLGMGAGGISGGLLGRRLVAKLRLRTRAEEKQQSQ